MDAHRVPSPWPVNRFLKGGTMDHQQAIDLMGLAIELMKYSGVVPDKKPGGEAAAEAFKKIMATLKTEYDDIMTRPSS